MILRKLADAFRRQDWFTVLLEVLIVMLGILLGLQVNAWNQSRIDRADEAVFMQALYLDVVEMERTSTELIALRLKALKAIESASDVLFGRAAWRELTAFECDVISTSHSPGVIVTSLPTWTALRDAGRTNIVQNKDLRQGLATLTQKRESLDRIMDIAEKQGYKILYQHPDLFVSNPVRTQLAEAPELIHFDAESTCDSEAFSQNQAAMNGLASNMNRYSAVLNRFGIIPWSEQVTEIKIILEREIGSDL